MTKMIQIKIDTMSRREGKDSILTVPYKDEYQHQFKFDNNGDGTFTMNRVQDLNNIQTLYDRVYIWSTSSSTNTNGANQFVIYKVGSGYLTKLDDDSNENEVVLGFKSYNMDDAITFTTSLVNSNEPTTPVDVSLDCPPGY